MKEESAAFAAALSRQNVAKEGWTTYYVNGANGDDGNNGLTWESPFLTIQHAVDTAESWCKIYVKAGTYAENVTINEEGIKIIGEKIDTVIIKPSSGRALAITSKGCTITNLTAIGNGLLGAAAAIYIGGDYNTIEHVIVGNQNSGGWGIAGYGDKVIIDDVSIDQSYKPDNGIVFTHGVYSETKNCIIKNVGKYGIYFASETPGVLTDFEVHDNTISNSGTYGINITAGSNNGIVYHNNILTSGSANAADLGTGNNWTENHYGDHIADTNNDGLCDSPYTFTTGTDYAPIPRRNGWKQTSIGYGSLLQLGSGTLNTAIANPHTATIAPPSLPIKMHIIFDISNLNTNTDDFEVQVSVGAAASERVIAWYGITSDGTDITCDTGSGVGTVIKQRRIDISNILVFTGEQVIASLKRNAGADDTVAYKYLCGV